MKPKASAQGRMREWNPQPDFWDNDSHSQSRDINCEADESVALARAQNLFFSSFVGIAPPALCQGLLCRPMMNEGDRVV